MPYPHEHSARIAEPGKYKRIRRENDKFGAGIDAIFGVLDDGTVELQAVRFDADRYTAEEAREWLKKNKMKAIAFEPASETKAAFLLSLRTPALALTGSREENGIPVRRYRKELIRTGRYIKATDGIAFEVTDKTLDHWAAVTTLWLAAGNKIPVTLTHQDAGNPDRNRGWLVDAHRDGGSLMGIIDLIGEKAEQLALTADVSLYSPPECTDGAGNVYLRPITHVALCTDPVIPGLKPFEAIAASLNTNQETEMSEIIKLLGLADDATEEQIIEAIKALLEAKEKTEAIEAAKTAAEKKTAESEKARADLELAMKPKMPDPLLVKLASENRDMKLRGLVSAARITPAVKARLAARFVEAEALALSLAKGDDCFDELVSILAENDPVKLKEQTGPQLLELSGPGSTKEPDALQRQVLRLRRQAGNKD